MSTLTVIATLGILVVVIVLGVLGIHYFTRTSRFISIAERPRDLARLETLRQESTPQRIMVSVASYRDPECARTVQRLVEHAAHPDHVRICVLEQNLRGDVKADALCGSHPSVQVERMSAREARGPLWARMHIAKCVRDDDAFVLQLDSHTYPCVGWDVECVREWERCNDARAILTMYPNDYDRENADGAKDTRATKLRLKYFNDDGVPELEAVPSAQSAPEPSAFWAAGFSFAPAQAARDMSLPLALAEDVFFGEEILQAMRLWTRGWNFYAPARPLAWHLWDRSYRPTFWENQDQERRNSGQRNTQRIRDLVRDRKSDDPPNLLGDARSVDDYFKFAGLD